MGWKVLRGAHDDLSREVDGRATVDCLMAAVVRRVKLRGAERANDRMDIILLKDGGCERVGGIPSRDEIQGGKGVEDRMGWVSRMENWVDEASARTKIMLLLFQAPEIFRQCDALALVVHEPLLDPIALGAT